MKPENQRVKLVLEDNSVFYGYSFGAEKSVAGEVVFNTGMIGYPELLTDPAYKGKILVLTYPLIGNYGIPSYEKKEGVLKFFESDKVQVIGLVVAEFCEEYNHWNAKLSLSDWLKENKVPAICGVDTRRLAKNLREKGVMNGKLLFDGGVEIENFNLTENVGIKNKVVYGDGKKRIVLIDCGVKNSLVRDLLKRRVSVLRVPWDYDFLKEDFNGVVISNGPGAPEEYGKTIKVVKKLLNLGKPIFGIGLGNEILAIAAGAEIYKLKFGHRSANQPCKDMETGRCFITSQNHGYSINAESLTKDWKEWYVNVNDNSNEGIKHVSKKFMGIDFYPEFGFDFITNDVFKDFFERM